MKRRTFIKASGAGLLAGMFIPRHAFTNTPPSKKTGLQLYSLRNELNDDLEGSLKRISEIGYKNLEAANFSNGQFYGWRPLDFRSLLDDLDMKLVSSHVTFENETAGEVLRAHKEVGAKYVVWPSVAKEQRETLAGWKDFVEKMNMIGKLCKDNGLRFGYHNHDFEFYPLEGALPYEVMLESTDPDLVFMEIDLFWIAYAGRDPVTYFENYPGRFELWHLKDMTDKSSKEMTEVGSGIIDYPSLFRLANVSGMKEFFIEQDDIRGDGFESVKKSFDYVNSIL